MSGPNNAANNLVNFGNVYGTTSNSAATTNLAVVPDTSQDPTNNVAKNTINIAAESASTVNFDFNKMSADDIARFQNLDPLDQCKAIESALARHGHQGGDLKSASFFFSYTPKPGTFDPDYKVAVDDVYAAQLCALAYNIPRADPSTLDLANQSWKSELEQLLIMFQKLNNTTNSEETRLLLKELTEVIKSTEVKKANRDYAIFSIASGKHVIGVIRGTNEWYDWAHNLNFTSAFDLTAEKFSNIESIQDVSNWAHPGHRLVADFHNLMIEGKLQDVTALSIFGHSLGGAETDRALELLYQLKIKKDYPFLQNTKMNGITFNAGGPLPFAFPETLKARNIPIRHFTVQGEALKTWNERTGGAIPIVPETSVYLRLKEDDDADIYDKHQLANFTVSLMALLVAPETNEANDFA
jgi:hypothetical protein